MRVDVKNNKIFIGGVEADTLVEEFGSPLYVYDAGIIKNNIDSLINAITYKKKLIKYACKANTNIEIMKIMLEKGLGIDAVSPGEIFASFKAGFKPQQILFTVTNPGIEELQYATENNILVNLDSLSTIETFGKMFPGSNICVRINPNVGAGHHNHVITGGPESKFGISYRDLTAVKEVAARYNLKIVGVHQHIGSGILDPDIFVTAMKVLLDVAVQFDSLEFIDFGGGIGVPYKPEDKPIDVNKLGEKITAEFELFCRDYGRELELIIEPGRFLVAESGYLLSKVTSIKKGERHLFIGTDTGFNHLVRPAMYGSYHEIYNASNPGAKPIKQVIAGNICESGDTFTRDENGIVDRLLPEFKLGDTICIANAGAYGYSMASFYNSRPRPAEVLIENGKHRLIRRRDTLEDIFKNCVC